jgi:hypothetical protein
MADQVFVDRGKVGPPAIVMTRIRLRRKQNSECVRTSVYILVVMYVVIEYTRVVVFVSKNIGPDSPIFRGTYGTLIYLAV